MQAVPAEAVQLAEVNMEKITIATRGSKLARWQAGFIASKIKKRYPHIAVEPLIVKTKGDKILDVPLAKIGDKGLFVKEIEEALLDGKADIAVHSMKDVPTVLPDGLIIGAIPERTDFSDSFVSWKYPTLKSLPAGARIGTSSLRRQSQILGLRPNLKLVDLRGNLDTRVQKVKDGGYDAIVVATAGLNRLNINAPHMQQLEPPDFYPAPAQGALGIEFLQERSELAETLAFLDNPDTRACVEAEREFLFTLEGGCQVPIAGLATMQDGNLKLCGAVFDRTGRRILRTRSDKATQAKRAGKLLAKEILAAGGQEMVKSFCKQ